MSKYIGYNIIKRKTDEGIKVEVWSDKNGKWEKVKDV